LIEFICDNYDYDFYITENNTRLYITDLKSLKNLFHQSHVMYSYIEHGELKGILSVWKSLGGGKTRYYIKIIGKSDKIGVKLLTVLLWNFDRDLYVKIRKHNKFVSIFRAKGFRFMGGRGVQILLFRKKVKMRENNERDIDDN